MVSRTDLSGQASSQRQIFVRGEAVYQCDVCKRKIRVPTNKYSVDVVQRCIITKTCLGKLHKVPTLAEANDTSAIPPALPNVVDWSQRRVFHEHLQVIANQFWTVEHNLGTKPSVQVFTTQIQDSEEVLVEVEPKAIRVVDLNTVEIEFESPQKGQAECITYSSVNTVNPTAGSAMVSAIETLQLTSNGHLTIATLDASLLVNVVARYRSANAAGGVLDLEYIGISSPPSINSPWAGVRRAFINGRTYSIRSFSITNQPQAPAVFAANLIANGTQFYFPNITTPNHTLILMGTSPFTVVDRIVDRYVDIASIDTEQPEIAYTAGEAYTTSDIVKSVYPYITVVD